MAEQELNKQTQEQELNKQTQEQESSQEQNSADFLSGFNSVRNSDEQSPEPVRIEKEVAEVKKPEQQPEVNEPESQKKEEPLIAGMTESQIRSLLERVTKVDEIENQLRRAHGKIGELNANLQNLSSQQAKPTQQAPASAANDEELSQLEKDFPELATIAEAKARKIIAEQLSGMTASAAVSQAPANESDIAALISEAVLDATHEGWREKISSQDFTLWIATQPEGVQETFNTTNSAKELGKVIKDFDSWKANTQDRSNRNKRRLEESLLPSGVSAKVSHAPSAHDEFLAGFNAVRSQYS